MAEPFLSVEGADVYYGASQILFGVDLAVEAAVAGTGIVALFEDWLRPHLDSGALEPVLEPWWQQFSGPFLYYPGRRLVPAPLRAFVDFIKQPSGSASA